MNKNELSSALEIAKSDADLTSEDIAVFNGFGLHTFQTVYVTVRQVARLLRWQAQYLSGNWDANAMQEVANAGRTKFQIIG